MPRRACPHISVAGSSIQGQGVFAEQAIRRGTAVLRLDDSRVIDSEHPLLPEHGESKLHLDFLPDSTVVLMQSPECYLNHSCEPNCFVYSVQQERYLLAMRDVYPGEELLIDYAVNAIGGDLWECHCAAATCRGSHTCDFFLLPKPIQIAYLPYLDPWFAAVHAPQIGRLLAEAWDNW